MKANGKLWRSSLVMLFQEAILSLKGKLSSVRPHTSFHSPTSLIQLNWSHPHLTDPIWFNSFYIYIFIANILPPPDDFTLPIVKLLTHPTYRDYQSRTAALSLYSNIFIKFIPPIWGAATPPTPAPHLLSTPLGGGGRGDPETPNTPVSNDTVEKKEWKRRIKMYSTCFFSPFPLFLSGLFQKKKKNPLFVSVWISRSSHKKKPFHFASLLFSLSIINLISTLTHSLTHTHTHSRPLPRSLRLPTRHLRFFPFPIFPHPIKRRRLVRISKRIIRWIGDRTRRNRCCVLWECSEGLWVIFFFVVVVIVFVVVVVVDVGEDLPPPPPSSYLSHTSPPDTHPFPLTHLIYSPPPFLPSCKPRVPKADVENIYI